MDTGLSQGACGGFKVSHASLELDSSVEKSVVSFSK